MAFFVKNPMERVPTSDGFLGRRLSGWIPGGFARSTAAVFLALEIASACFSSNTAQAQCLRSLEFSSRSAADTFTAASQQVRGQGSRGGKNSSEKRKNQHTEKAPKRKGNGNGDNDRPALSSGAGSGAHSSSSDSEAGGVSAENPPPPPPEFRLPDPTDPLDRLYGRKRLSFADGAPALNVGLMEGQTSIRLTAKSRAVLSSGEQSAKVAADAPLVFTVRNAKPAKILYHAVAGDFAVSETREKSEALAKWKKLGQKPQIIRTGSRFGVAGQVIDTRRDLIVIGGELPEKKAAEFADSLMEKFSAHVSLHPVLSRRPSGIIDVAGADGKIIMSADTAAFLTPERGGLIAARQVESGVGYSDHGFPDRTYRGSLAVALDASGALALVNIVDLESYIRGIVASEIFSSAHQEALKAQAVTARGEVLAKLGTRHLGDPFQLCDEQHCQVYSGVTGETANTDKAVRATEGEFLFDASGSLVDSTYSAVCGGHTENNEVVWGTRRDESLRGRPDSALAPREAAASPINLRNDADLHRFLTEPPKAFCSTASLASQTRFRWEKRFSTGDIDEIFRDLGVGRVFAMKFSDRGVSGRAATLTVSGDVGVRQIRGELNIRRRLKNLNSTMAEIISPESPEGQGQWIFRGGGWGHGVGMCQIGAIGRAEAGHSYRAILGHYFGGAQVKKIYGSPGGTASGRRSKQSK